MMKKKTSLKNLKRKLQLLPKVQKKRKIQIRIALIRRMRTIPRNLKKLQLLPKMPKKRKVQTLVALILRTRRTNLLRKRQRSKKRLQRTMMTNLWLKKAVLILQTKVSIKVLQVRI